MSTIREAFEAHIVAEGWDGKHWLQRWASGDAAFKERYMKDWVQTAWEAYQAATERAANLCDSLGGAIDMRKPDDVKMCANSLAAAIRAQTGGEG